MRRRRLDGEAGPGPSYGQLLPSAQQSIRDELLERGIIKESNITKSRKHGAMTLQPVSLVLADGRINVDVPGAAEGRGAEVWLCGLMKTATVAIGRGENQGRTVTYHNVVRRWLKLGDWTGRANSWNVPLQALEQDGIDRAAVLVQSGTAERPKMILGATLATLR